MYVSIDLVEEVIERQIKKYKTKIVDKKQSATAFSELIIQEEAEPEEACLQMELLGHDFFMFLNSETEQINVVYKRKANTYGLIEPEN